MRIINPYFVGFGMSKMTKYQTGLIGLAWQAMVQSIISCKPLPYIAL